MTPPESTTTPVIASGEPPTTVLPSSAVLKPDVEGNRGKSQLFDVADLQGPQAIASAVSSPDTVAEVSTTNRDYRAIPMASGVDALICKTGDADQSGSQSDWKVASRRENGSAVTDLALSGNPAQTSESPSLDRSSP